MRKGRKLILLTGLMMVLVIGLTLSLAACKPGYKETWDPIAPYDLAWEDNNDIAIVTGRINVDKIAEVKEDRKNFKEEGKANPYDPQNILPHITSEGKFDDINYESDSKTYWAPLDHLKKVLYLQVAYNDPQDSYYQSSEIAETVKAAMKHWAKVNYTCDWNWWYNDVGVGMYLPNIILFGNTGLSEEEKSGLLGNYEKTLLHTQPMRFRLYERKCNQAGGNLTDQALATIKYCCATNDGNTFMWVKEQIENELRFFPDWNPKHHRWDAEGIKEDYSFLQHDQLIYFGGYGEVFMDGLATYLNYTKGTQYAISAEKLDFLTTFLMEGIQFSTRGGYRDISASGRGISRGPHALKGIYTQLKRCVDALLTYDNISDSSKALLNNFILTRDPKADQGAGGHRYFYKADYSVMNSQKYMATVRHASRMTRVFEVLNGENAKGYNTGFGATFFYVDGSEYDETLGAWDWNKIPGTTVRQSKKTPQVEEWYSYDRYGRTAANGVSNKKVGVSHLNMADKGVNAKKAYFMFEDGVVCLGTDIWSMNVDETYTTINQVRKDGDVIVVNGNEDKNIELGYSSKIKADLIYHDNIAYISNNELSLNVKEQSGDFKDLNLRTKDSQPFKTNMFELGINHGKLFSGKDYEYTVLMNTSLENAKSYKANPTLKVVSNNKKVQAVEDTKNNVAEAIFHKSAKIKLLGVDVTVKGKGCVILEKIGEKILITVSSYDAAKENKIEIAINNVAGAPIVAKPAPTLITSPMN